MQNLSEMAGAENIKSILEYAELSRNGRRGEHKEHIGICRTYLKWQALRMHRAYWNMQNIAEMAGAQNIKSIWFNV